MAPLELYHLCLAALGEEESLGRYGLFSSCDLCFSQIWFQSSSSPGALLFGSHCSFEQDACGWSLSNQHSAWRRVAGDELLEKEDMQGVTLQSTPGWQCVCVCVCVCSTCEMSILTPHTLILLRSFLWVSSHSNYFGVERLPNFFSSHISHCSSKLISFCHTGF